MTIQDSDVIIECMRKRSWTDTQLVESVKNAHSVRSVIQGLGLVPAGGNYAQITARIAELRLDTSHFTGQAWNKGWRFDPRVKVRRLEDLLVRDSSAQSHKLKRRLVDSGMKTLRCELCSWAKMSIDGRIPLELDHINGDHRDNRIENLRILCPNCHSLQPTHRGRNKKLKRARMS